MFQLEDILENAQKLEQHGDYKKASHLYKRLQKKAPDSEVARISQERLSVIDAWQNGVQKPVHILEWIALYMMLFSFSGAFFITYPLSFVIQSSSAVLNLYIGLVCVTEVLSIGLLMVNKLYYQKTFKALSVMTMLIDVLTILLGIVAVIAGA